MITTIACPTCGTIINVTTGDAVVRGAGIGTAYQPLVPGMSGVPIRTCHCCGAPIDAVSYLVREQEHWGLVCHSCMISGRWKEKFVRSIGPSETKAIGGGDVPNAFCPP